ncbi:MAG: hypothetical protein GY756_15880 [bacterium]|nr:hypothetical protein [bacterium]
MKKLILLTLCLSVALMSNSQNTFPEPGPGDVGIGTTNPQELLHVENGNIGIEEGNIIISNSGINQLDSGRIIFNEYGTGSASLGGASINFNGASNFMHIKTNTESNEMEHIRIKRLSHLILQPEANNVGIGTLNPTEKLTVNGKILCKEVEVILDVPADYVFQKYYLGVSTLKADYQMPTLEEVEAYIKTNHHLPEVPSAQEIKDEGLQLKEMTNLLLQKIEELTLYTIEQEKRIEVLEGKLETHKQ